MTYSFEEYDMFVFKNQRRKAKDAADYLLNNIKRFKSSSKKLVDLLNEYLEKLNTVDINSDGGYKVLLDIRKILYTYSYF